MVWSQGREGVDDQEGSESFGGDMRNLFDQRADNTFLVKFSYWFAW